MPSHLFTLLHNLETQMTHRNHGFTGCGERLVVQQLSVFFTFIHWGYMVRWYWHFLSEILSTVIINWTYYCVYLFQPPIPTNKLGVEPKRPGRPVNITPQCHLSAAAPNHIIVNWNPEMGRVSRHANKHDSMSILEWESYLLGWSFENIYQDGALVDENSIQWIK